MRVTRQCRFRAAEAALDLQVGSHCQQAYLGDDCQIAQILNKLLGNPITFSRHGGQVCLHVEEDIRLDARLQLHFSVTDNGLGISEPALSRIFEPYAQAATSTSRRFGGAGLGLNICRELVALMHGKIWVTRLEDAGSAFHFTVCMDAALRLVPRVEALKALGKNRARCVAVLMDCQMPVMDGYERTRLRQAESEHPELGRVRIIALTGNAMAGDRERCRAVGMDDYLAKPVDPQRLAALLDPL